MSLLPKRLTREIITEGVVDSRTQPSKTYALDLMNKTLTNDTIDGESALRQFVVKTTLTARFRYLIYSTDYGCELEELIGKDVSEELLKVEIPRVVKEALLIDDRIEDVLDFSIDNQDGTLIISFRVVAVEGYEFFEEVVI